MGPMRALCGPSSLQVEYVIESTGLSVEADMGQGHIDAGAHPNTDRSTNTNADKDTNTGTHRGTHACADTTPIKLPDASVGGVVMQWRRRGAHPRGRHTPDRPPAVLSDTELRQIMR